VIDRLVAAASRRRRARAAAYPERRRSLARPVISVGNISMGGSGKSPLVAYVARRLLDMGNRPAVLSRGYARPRHADGAVVVSDGTRVLAGYEVAGDEPLMLARQIPGCAVVVSPDRYLAGALAERRLGCTVHILDDGFQHLQLNRALDMLLVRRADLGGRVMPFGRLREPVDAVAAADVVIVLESDGLEEAVRRLGARRIFRMSRQLAAGGEEPVFAFAGIARPEEFFDSLARAGWKVVGSAAFADHHRYSSGELARLFDDARRTGARRLVTTEKDAVRVPEATEMPIDAVPMTVSVEPADEFAALLARVCAGGGR
jgi:tetraacyldisaccharide 4'-kinase